MWCAVRVFGGAGIMAAWVGLLVVVGALLSSAVERLLERLVGPVWSLLGRLLEPVPLLPDASALPTSLVLEAGLGSIVLIILIQTSVERRESRTGFQVGGFLSLAGAAVLATVVSVPLLPVVVITWFTSRVLALADGVLHGLQSVAVAVVTAARAVGRGEPGRGRGRATGGVGTGRPRLIAVGPPPGLGTRPAPMAQVVVVPPAGRKDHDAAKLPNDPAASDVQ